MIGYQGMDKFSNCSVFGNIVDFKFKNGQFRDLMIGSIVSQLTEFSALELMFLESIISSLAAFNGLNYYGQLLDDMLGLYRKSILDSCEKSDEKEITL